MHHRNKSFELRTFGHSMYPFLQDGDVVTVKPASYNSLKYGDIVCVRQSNSFLTHRIIYKTTTGIITKGDFSQVADKKSAPQDIIGTITAVRRGNISFRVTDIAPSQYNEYLKKIRTLVKALHREKINFIILSGIPIELLYGNTTPPQLHTDCADIAILVPPDQCIETTDILLSLGYDKMQLYDKFGRKINNEKYDELIFSQVINGFLFTCKVQMNLGITTTTIDSFPIFYPQIKMDALKRLFFSEKQTYKDSSSRFPLPKIEHLILYVLLHISRHSYHGVYRYMLLSRLFDQRAVKWNNLYFLINNFNLDNFIYPTLLILLRYFPPKKIKKLQDLILSLEPNRSTTQFTNNILIKEDIFSDTLPVGARFISLLILSPQPLFQKLLIFLNLNFLKKSLSALAHRQ